MKFPFQIHGLMFLLFIYSPESPILQTEVTTVICANKELKKLLDISGQLDTVKRIVCMDNEMSSNGSLIERGSSWTITSFSEVERLGQENPTEADLPLSADIAVIMYTSGSTGLPKVCKGAISFSSFPMCYIHLILFLGQVQI